MKKTTNFFVISNFNSDPSHLLKYTDNYIIYDQSKDRLIIDLLQNKKTININYVKNTGHNISDYFNFFIDNYDHLPDVMVLAKGNLIGRHVSEKYFNRVYDNKYFTFLYNDEKPIDGPHRSHHLFEGAYIEKNNSWYFNKKVNHYFHTYNELLNFLFMNPIIPEWTLFAPGACYIITREHVLKYPKVFWKNLLKIITYDYFPSEAYMVERMLPTIFLGNYELNSHILSEPAFNHMLNTKYDNYLIAKKDGRRPLIWYKKKASRILKKICNILRFAHIELFR